MHAGQMLARIDTADLEAQARRAAAARSSRAKAQLALADKTRAMNRTLLEAEFHLAERVRQRRIELNVARGQRQVGRGAGAARAERAARRGRHVAACRHRREAPRSAGRKGRLRLPARDDRRLEGPRGAGDGAGGRRARSSRSACRSSSSSTASASAASPAASTGSTRPTEPGTRAILVYVGIPNPDAALRGGMFATGRIALAASAPAPTLPATAVRTEAGQAYRLDDRRRQARQAHRRHRPPRRDERPRRDQDRAAAQTRRCSPHASTT